MKHKGKLPNYQIKLEILGCNYTRRTMTREENTTEKTYKLLFWEGK